MGPHTEARGAIAKTSASPKCVRRNVGSSHSRHSTGAGVACFHAISPSGAFATSPTPPAAVTDARRDELAVVGSAEECREKIDSLVKTRFEEVPAL